MNQNMRNQLQAKWGIGLLLVLYVLSVVCNLGMLELEGEEPRRAVVSLEMMHSGNYFNPTLFGWPYYNKPPVYNWILIGFIQLFRASSEFVLRLPSLVFYLLWAGVHYQFVKKHMSRQWALLSAFILLTSGDIYFYGLGQGAEIDVFYSFVVYLQAIAIFHYYQQAHWLRLYIVSYLLCALGLLTKGFPSVVFEGLTLVALCLYARSAKPLLRWQHLAGMGVFALVTGSYFWVYSLQGNVEHLLVNFLNESLTKSAIGERSDKVFEKAVAYPFLLFKLVAPWTLLLFLLFVKKVRMQVWQNPLVRFSILFIACNLWIYWLTGQPKARYVYMFAPFAAVVFVQLLQSYVATHAAPFDRVLKGFAGLFVVVSIALYVLPFVIDLNPIASIAVATLLAVFCWRYLKASADLRIWFFIGGIMLLRMVYAVVFIPFQDKGKAYYEAPVVAAAQAFGRGPLAYWAPPDTFVVRIETKLFAFKADTLLVPPHIHPQIPYYYYRHTGQLMRYDSAYVPARNQVSFARHLQGRIIDTAGVFADKRRAEEIVMYRGR